MFEAYVAWEETLAKVQLVAFMLGMGLNLSVGEFTTILRRPRSLLAALIGQVLVLPFLAVVVNYLGRIEGGVAVGIVLVAAMPGGGLAKVFTYLGRGNIPLSITLSVVSTLLALVTVPVVLRLLAADYLPEHFTMPVAAIMLEVFLFLLLPLAVGLFAGRTWPGHRKLLSRICIRFGLMLVIVIVAGSLGSGRIRPGSHGFGVPVAIILFCVVGMQINMLPFYLFPWPRADRMAAGIEVTMRNVNLALLLYAAHFARDEVIGPGVLFVVFFYAAVAMIAGALLALNHRRMSTREKIGPESPEAHAETD